MSFFSTHNFNTELSSGSVTGVLYLIFVDFYAVGQLFLKEDELFQCELLPNNDEVFRAGARKLLCKHLVRK